MPLSCASHDFLFQSKKKKHPNNLNNLNAETFASRGSHKRVDSRRCVSAAPIGSECYFLSTIGSGDLLVGSVGYECCSAAGVSSSK